MKKYIILSIIIFIISINLFGQTKYESKIYPNIDTNVIIPPSWAFGILYGGYTDQSQTITRIEEIIKHDYPIDAYWIDSWFWSFRDGGKGPKKYIDFVADTESYSDRKGMWNFMEQHHIKGGFWTWDCIMKTGNEEAFEDFNSKGYFKNVYLEKNTWHNSSQSMGMDQTNEEHPGTLCGNINFDDPLAADHFKKRMKPFFDEGADFLKLDRTADINTCKTIFEISQDFGKESKGRGFMLSHSFTTDNEEYKKYPAKWTDDTRSDWSIEKTNINFPVWTPKVALKENITMFTDPKNTSSSIPFLTNDTGGFEKGEVKQPDEELFIRWLQFSIFNPITELFCGPENPTSNLPWKYSVRADSIFHFYSHLRMQLFPYIYSYAHKTRLEGKNILRLIPDQLFEFLFGNQLLIAPIYEKGVEYRDIYIPEGKWYDYYSGVNYQGGYSYKIKININTIPMFVRAGAIIPMRKYYPSIEVGDNKDLFLNIYCGAEGTFDLVEDDGISNDYLNGRFSTSKIIFKENENNSKLILEQVNGNFKGKLKKRNYNLIFHNSKKPVIVKLNGREIDFNYCEKTNKLNIFLEKVKTKRRAIIEIEY